MIQFYEKIQNLGIESHLDATTIKKIRIINSLSVMTIIMVIVIIGYALTTDWPLIALLLLSLTTISLFVPLLLNYIHKTLASRVYYLISAYIIIISLGISFGKEVHYQYFLIGGIGIPFLLLENRIGNIRFLLSGLAIIFWLYLEWHFTKFPTLINIHSSYLFSIRLINDFLVFITVFCSIYFFITENDHHVEEIEKQTLQLKEINDELESFSYHVSHDLKAPLINIHSLIHLAKRKYSDDMNTELLQIFSMVETSSKRSKHLIDSILSYAKVGHDDMEVSKFNTYEVLKNIETLIQIPEGFHIQYKENLPTITGSCIQIEQVLTNLIGNAIKYHDKDQGIIKIDIKDIGTSQIKIYVKDNGPGIEQKYLKTIFNMFESANQQKREDSTGIGLAIVKKLVQKNGGEIGVDSTVGEGSTFWFTWPQSKTNLSS